MNAEDIAKALGASRTGAGWMARCPSHADRTPSLAICTSRSGKPLVHCFAGCSQAAVIAELRQLGYWGTGNTFSAGSVHTTASDNDRTDYSEYALSIWQASRFAAGTPAARYLRGRGLTLPIPASLRFNPGLKHPSGTLLPCMVGLFTRGSDGEENAIHRTFLTKDGSGKAPVTPNKMMLGPSRGGAVRLAIATDTVMVGEGIETCLAAMQATGRPAWAALSTSGLRTLNLPRTIRDIVVLADGDPPGEAAATAAARRWRADGRSVRIARPPAGMDFNDMLCAGAREVVA